MADKHLIEGIDKKIKSLSDLNISDYVRIETLGARYGFKEVEYLFLQIKNFTRQLVGFDFSIIPDRILDNTNGHIDTLLIALKNIQEFDPDKPRNGDKPVLIQRLNESYAQVFNSLLPLINYFSSSSNYIEEIKSETNLILTEIRDKRKEIENQKENLDKETKKIMDGLRDSAAKSGVTRHSKIFADEAREHKDLAFKWMMGLVLFILIALSIVYLIWNISPHSDNPKIYEIVQFSILKIIAFSILYYLLVFIIRNYNAHRHNYIVNKHRQNALSTFETFVNSTTNPEIKDAVLLQTSQSIFSTQLSGYLKNENEDANPNKFIEIIRNASQTINK